MTWKDAVHGLCDARMVAAHAVAQHLLLFLRGHLLHASECFASVPLLESATRLSTPRKRNSVNNARYFTGASPRWTGIFSVDTRAPVKVLYSQGKSIRSGDRGAEAHGRTRTGTTDTNITPHPPTKTKYRAAKSEASAGRKQRRSPAVYSQGKSIRGTGGGAHVFTHRVLLFIPLRARKKHGAALSPTLQIQGRLRMLLRRRRAGA